MKQAQQSIDLFGVAPMAGPGALWHVRCAQALLVAMALSAMLIAAIATPEWVAHHLSSDGQLTAGTITAVYVGRAICVVMAILLLVIAAKPGWIQGVLAEAIAGNTGIGPAALYGTLATVAILGVGFLISAITGTHIGYLLRDPNAIAGLPFYYGALEYAGIVLMAMAGGIAIFSGSLLSGSTRVFLVTGGLLTLLLVCDDLYMIHENSGRFYLNEKVTFAVYGLLALLFAIGNFRHLLNSPFLLLGAAAFFFAAALLFDSIPGLAQSLPRGSEDMVELAGICFWSTYFMKHSRDLVHAAPASRQVG